MRRAAGERYRAKRRNGHVIPRTSGPEITGEVGAA